MMLTDNQEALLTALTAEINNQAYSCAAEQHLPRHDPDASDEYISQRQLNVKELRGIRDRLEDIFSGFIHRKL